MLLLPRFMILDEQSAQSRLNSPANLANRFASGSQLNPTNGSHATPRNSNVNVIPIHQPGNKTGRQLPQFARNAVATLVRSGVTQKEAGEAFGITQSAAGYLASEKSITTSKPENKKQIEDQLSGIRDVALERLMLSMGLLTEDKLSKCRATDLSQIAANMSRVVEKTLPRTEGGAAVSITIYAPEQRKEEGYAVVEVTGS